MVFNLFNNNQKNFTVSIVCQFFMTFNLNFAQSNANLLFPSLSFVHLWKRTHP